MSDPTPPAVSDTMCEAVAPNVEWFDVAYRKACETSDPQHWMEAALLGQQLRNAVLKTVDPAGPIASEIARLTERYAKLFDAWLKARDAQTAAEASLSRLQADRDAAVAALARLVTSFECDPIVLSDEQEDAHGSASDILASDILASEIARLTGERDAQAHLVGRLRESMEAAHANADEAMAQAEAAEAETARLRAALEWQPMDSAPTDGARVDLWDGNCRRADCHFADGRWSQYSGHRERVPRYVSGFKPTHWRHRPAPPARAALSSQEQADV